MRNRTAVFAFATAVSVVFLATPAQAVCEYHGNLYAKTTVAQEFQDSELVVRAQVVSKHDYEDADGYAVRYRLRLKEQFKGNATDVIWLDSRRDSGGFYLEGADGKLDRGVDRLLFLNAMPSTSGKTNSYFQLNYSCGQSKTWSEVSADERKYLVTHKLQRTKGN